MADLSPNAAQQMGLHEAARIVAESLASISSRSMSVGPGLGQELAKAMAIMEQAAQGMVDNRAEIAQPSMAQARQSLNRTVAALLDRDPVVVDDELDEDVGELEYSLAQFYRDLAAADARLGLNLDTMLRAPSVTHLAGTTHVAALNVAALEGPAGQRYRWTGHFPERTRVLVHHLRARAQSLELCYRTEEEPAVTVALTTLVTSLAMNYVQSGGYLR
jgi:hypothetical protein